MTRSQTTTIERLELRALLASSLVADAVGLYPTTSVTIGELSFFTADDGVHGRELWKSDGTPAGTVMVRDVTRGSGGTRVRAMMALGDLLLFNVKDRDGNVTLWRSDGTDAGTTIVHDFVDGVWVSDFAVFDGKALFVAAPAPGVADLWTTDGTPQGTALVEQLYDDGPTDLPVASQFHPAGDRLVWFDANSDLHSTDGTAEGTFDLTDALGDTSEWALLGVQRFDGELYVNTLVQDGLIQLWKTDGTVAGSQLLFDRTGGGSGLMIADAQRMYFTRFVQGTNGTNTSELWASDGTAGGTQLVTSFDVDGGFDIMTPLSGGDLLFGLHARLTPGTGDYRFALWRSDGTAEGTHQLKQITTDQGSPGPFVEVGGTFFLLVHRSSETTGDLGPSELWRTDGTADGTALVAEVATGAAPLQVTLTLADGKLVVTRPTGGTLVYNPETMKEPSGPVEGTIKVTDRVMRILGTSGDDAIKIYRHADDTSRFVVNLNGLKRSFAFADVRKILVHGYSGNDNIAVNEVNGLVGLRTVIWGGPGDDTLCTGAGHDTLWGEDGDDTFHASRGHDVISGGNGADAIRGSAGDDTLAGNSGDDHLFGHTGTDLLAGGDGADEINGGIGVDVLFGQAVIDVFFNGGIDGDEVDEAVLVD